MIHRIAVSNFYCVRDRVELDMAVSGHAPGKPERFALGATTDRARTPKVIGLFGPNASGKSTILRVLGFVSWYIQHGFRLAPSQPIPWRRFNGKSHLDGPASLELEFDAPTELSEAADPAQRCRYVYSITLDGGSGQPAYIKDESLWYWPPAAARRICIFERDREKVKRGGQAFQLRGYVRAVPKVLRPNVSLISTLAQLGHEPSVVLRDIASKIETNIFLELHSLPEHYIAEAYLNDKRMFADLNREITRFDLGITEVAIAQPTNERNYPDTTFIHRGLAGPLPVNHESEGTRQFFRIFPMISQALHHGGVAVIDEFDSSIHSLVLPEILRWFYDPKRNTKNAQLWFTGQNHHLLQELEKEQIILCEKDDGGASTAFNLSDIKAVRRIDNFAKKYLGGAYGAVPHFG